ncbi:GTP-binding protein [Candidatus Woesearchaeota archaeon]|jgi:uncharacterized protein|nr:GTP-binding protein [Candidatus Woesearchaeota archaeon]MBT4387150.1 GTP-binding protein [Candidatus Woesearchaeota archaeon]MBT4596093.1 GTP-binding protein [Candidatus Woesearchaeota archaeon]MBT5741685.1 GTP-binding protein [Candidatus Woesearchaeota archaeon]MBT6505145.1 GTP-binding protein [Candidatus Woesearchaeota archaeon]
MAIVVKGKKKKEEGEKSVKEKLSSEDEIKELETKISKTKYNKKTQFAIGQMKAKLAKLKEKQASRSSGKGGHGFSVKKSGDGTVALLGFPSVGKSTLMNKLTGSKSSTGSYAFTTLDVIPSLLKHRGAQIQILDIPGIVKGAASGSGRGREVLAALRSADLILILLDVLHLNHLKVLKKEIFEAGIRENKIKPDVKLMKKDKGGVNIATTVKLTKINNDTIKIILKEFGYVNADIVIRDNIDSDDLIDVINGNRVYTKSMIVINKADLIDVKKLNNLKKEINASIAVSAETGYHIDKLKDHLFDKLEFIKIYCKEKGKEADMSEPLILLKGSTVKEMCIKLHKDFLKKFRFAKIWGPSSKFPGQTKMLEHKLMDNDIVEISTN